MNVIGMIPARYKSSRFPGKPLALILGKSLIQHTYENTKRCKELKAVIVATDDERIFEHVRGFQGDVVMTSPDCLTGTDRLCEVVRKDPQFNQYDIIINVQGDVPCLEPEVITQLIEALRNDPEAVLATPVTLIRSQEELQNPSVVKCVKDLNSNALYFSRSVIPGGKKQPEYYHHVGIYAFRREFLLKYAELSPTPLQLAEDLEQLKVLEHGYKIKVVIVDADYFGVDHPEDIQRVEKILRKER